MFRRAYQSVQRAITRTVLQVTVAVGVVEVTTHLPSQGRSSRIYHYVSDEIITPSLRQCLNAEQAHAVAIWACQAGLAPQATRISASEQRVQLSTRIPFGPQQNHHRVTNEEGSTAVERSPSSTALASTITPTMTTTTTTSTQDEAFSLRNNKRPDITADGVLTFPNPIGLAAGFDKDGVIIPSMLLLGFGFVEIGTVTPKPQPGNPRPRMFRLKDDQAIINRYGFNSMGCDMVKDYLQSFRQFQQQQQLESRPGTNDTNAWWQILYRFLYGGPSLGLLQGLVGVNIGKNMDSNTETDIIQDYVHCIQELGPYADYLVVNVSSPNTEHLRDWQQPAALQTLLRACLQARDALLLTEEGGGQQRQQHPDSSITAPTGPSHKKYVPLLVKLAPDLTDTELESIAEACIQVGIDGIIVCNTTKHRPNDLVGYHRHEVGGLSGKPLRDVSTEMIRKLFRYTRGNIPIIGVGGVENGRDVYAKLRAGASLVQVYSMMVYHGPGLISRLRKELADCMLDNGHRTVEDVIGFDHEDIYWQKREERQLRQQQQHPQQSPPVLVIDQL